VTLEEVFQTMPYENELVSVELSGTELLAALTRGVQGAREDEDGGFLHVAGLHFRVRGRAVEEVQVGREALIPASAYRVAITDFMASGGDGYEVFVGKPQVKTGLPLRELIVEEIRSRGEISARTDNRIIRQE
jgi:5'-nucleotidase